jgi:hypothetical protein
VNQTFWTNKFSTLKSEYQTLVQQCPEANVQLKQLLKVPGDIEDVGRIIPVSVGESAGASYCKGLHGKLLFSALYNTYRVRLHEFKAVLKASTLAGQTNLPKATGQQKTQEGSIQ